MISEEMLTNEFIAEGVFNLAINLKNAHNQLPHFSIDLHWTGILYEMALPIIIDKKIQLKIEEDEITFEQYDLDLECYIDIREPAPPSSGALSYPLTAHTINNALCLIILNKDNL